MNTSTLRRLFLLDRLNAWLWPAASAAALVTVALLLLGIQPAALLIVTSAVVLIALLALIAADTGLEIATRMLLDEPDQA
jgi:hypothetical protein